MGRFVNGRSGVAVVFSGKMEYKLSRRFTMKRNLALLVIIALAAGACSKKEKASSRDTPQCLAILT